MQEPEYGNMLLLEKMEDYLENLMHQRRQKYITKNAFSKLIDKIHLDTEGFVVEPFSALADRQDRSERQQIWFQSLAVDLEEECLIK